MNPEEEKLPDSLRPFFWDVDFGNLLADEHSYFIISRLLERGDETAVRFLYKTYSREQMIRVLRTSRSISRRSRNFWCKIFDVKEETCTPKRYPTPYGDYFKD